MSGSDWTPALEIGSLALLVLQGLLVWALWSLRKQFVPRAKCEAKCAAMAARQTRLAQAEAELAQAQKMLPRAEELRAVQVRLAEIEGSIKAVKATVEGQTELIQRIERPLQLLLEHHLSGGDR